MANITRNTFDQSKDRVKVVIQRGQPALLDSELNEMQDILRANAAEATALQAGPRLAADSVHSATLDAGNAGVGMRFAYVARAAECLPSAVHGGGTDTFFIAAGAMFVDGVRYYLAADLNTGIVLAAMAGLNVRYGYLYADVVFAEANSIADPSIATPQLGETSVREVVSVTWNYSEDAATYEAAWNAIPALTAVAGSRIWLGNTARVVVAKYLRTSASCTVVSMLQPMQRLINAFGVARRTTGGTCFDGMIAWNGSTHRLIVGMATTSPTDAAGIQLRTLALSGSTNTLLSENNATLLDQDAGTPVRPLAATGYNIPAGSALGYHGPGTDTVRQTSFLPDSGSQIYDNNAASPTSAVLLLGQRPIVQAQESFGQDSSTFVICTCIGDDLVFFNGQVLKGDTNGRWTFLELGGTPSVYDAVIENIPSGLVHLSGTDALERALAWSADGVGAGGLGTGRRLRFHLRKGHYSFSRLVQTFGTTLELAATAFLAYDANGTALEISGDGKEATQIDVLNIPAGGRADPAMLSLAAGRVKLQGLAVVQLSTDPNDLGLTLKIDAREVILEDCYFAGPVHIAADLICIKNCAFGTPGKITAYLNTSTAYPITPMHLQLQPQSSTRAMHRITVEDCEFDVIDAHTSACAASVLLTGLYAEKTEVLLERCTFVYNDTLGQSPAAIHVDSDVGNVCISRCYFRGALGYNKAGALVGDFLTDYKGTPISKSTIDTHKGVATAYVSCTGARAHGADRLTVQDCSFSFANVGNQAAFQKFSFWGGMTLVQDSLTMTGSADAVTNVVFQRNTLDFFNTNGNYAREGLGFAGGAMPQVTGFYMSPTMANSVSKISYQNIRVENNLFDLGGGPAGNKNNTFRSRNQFPVSFFGATPETQDNSAPISIMLKNTTCVAQGVLWTDRSAHGVVVRGNQLVTRAWNGGAMPIIRGAVTVDASQNYNWIYLENGCAPDAGSTNQVGKADAGADYLPDVTVGQFVKPMVLDNHVDASYWQPMAGGCPLSIDNCWQPLIANNIVYTSVPGAGTEVAISANSYRAFVHSNVATANNTIYTNSAGGNVAYASNNLADVSGAAGNINASKKTYVGDSNFEHV